MKTHLTQTKIENKYAFKYKISSKLSFVVCGNNMYSLVGKKLQRRRLYEHMIDASLEFGLHFGHSNFNGNCQNHHAFC